MVALCCGGEGAPGGSFYRARASTELRVEHEGRRRVRGGISGIEGEEGKGRPGRGRFDAAVLMRALFRGLDHDFAEYGKGLKTGNGGCGAEMETCAREKERGRGRHYSSRSHLSAKGREGKNGGAGEALDADPTAAGRGGVARGRGGPSGPCAGASAAGPDEFRPEGCCGFSK